MSDNNASDISSAATPLCGKSWTAYIGTALLAAILFLFLLPLSFKWNQTAAACVLAGSALIVGYRALSIRSYQLYYDDVGVWLTSGILPWSKGLSGVKWRDMDEATFQPSFFSWLFKSYSIRIGHRYTKSSEISLRGMARGKEAVMTLNAQLQEMIRRHAID